MRMVVGAIAGFWIAGLCYGANPEEPNRPTVLIAYTQHRTNLPGGRQAKIVSRRGGRHVG